MVAVLRPVSDPLCRELYRERRRFGPVTSKNFRQSLSKPKHKTVAIGSGKKSCVLRSVSVFLCRELYRERRRFGPVTSKNFRQSLRQSLSKPDSLKAKRASNAEHPGIIGARHTRFKPLGIKAKPRRRRDRDVVERLHPLHRIGNTS
jgi:hypothetical protein